MRPAALLVILAPAFVLGGCAVRQEVAAPPAYSQVSPYAPGTYPHGSFSVIPAPQVIAPVSGSYCEEAVGEAQDAAVRAQASGSPRDASRANRTAGYVTRDCR